MAELPPLADAEILAARGPRAAVDPAKPYAFFVEPEAICHGGHGSLEDVATIFTTNPECPFRCLVCDLWKYTTPRSTVAASVADQVEWALARLADANSGNHAPHVKIYNAGSFFDTGSISLYDRARIAKAMLGRGWMFVF